MASITPGHIASLQATNGIPITITRGTQTCSLTAVPAASTAQLTGSDGSFTEVTIDDWLLLVSEFTLTDPATPKKGDVITVDEATKYLVAHPDARQPAFRNFNQLDRPAVAWRVHSMPR